MGSSFRIVCLVSAFTVLWTSCSATLGDGIYIPPAAYAVKPAIPGQRAMIVFRDGVETLIVESTYRTDAPDAGWIVPVPSVPTKIDSADPGLLESLSWCIGPRVKNEARDVKGGSVYLFVLCLFAMAVGITPGTHKLLEVLLTVLVIVLFSSCLLPSLGTSGTSAVNPGGIDVIGSHRVGNYEIEVIRATDSQALADWLAGQKLQSLQPADRAVFDQYIAEGWCFVVAHLVADASAAVTPHPLAVTFPVAQPLFPMRATALANSTTAVELFIVADQQASADGFRQIVADWFKLESTPPGGDEFNTSRAMVGSDRALAIGHPGAVQHFWNGCIVTRLDATLETGKMQSDVQIALGPFTGPYRQVLRGPGYRWDMTLMALFIGATVVSLLFLMVRWAGRTPLSHEAKALKGLGVAAVLVPAMVYFAVPTVQVRELKDSWWRAEMSHRYKVSNAQQAIREEALDASIIDSMDQFLSRLAPGNFDDRVFLNPITGEPMVPARTPGNYMVLREGERTYLCLYDLAARETRFLLPPARGGAAATRESAASHRPE